MKIAFFDNTIDALDVGYDNNGNRRYVIHFLPIWREISERTGIEVEALSSADYRHALNACSVLGGKKYHNRKYGGGIVFTCDKSELGAILEDAVTRYSAWTNANCTPNDTIVNAIDERLKHYLPITVIATNGGYIAKGEYAYGLKLRVHTPYDHSKHSRQNPMIAALRWLQMAEYKRNQIEGAEAMSYRLNDAYTTLDTNTYIFTYSSQYNRVGA